MITFFGASVTAQMYGYAKMFRRNICEDVKIFGYGGMHLKDAGICFIDDVLKVKPSYCFVDFFSTGYDSIDENTKEYIDTIIYRFTLAECKLIFLFFPRRYEKLNEWYLFLKSYLTENDIYYIEVDSKILDVKLNAILKDDVHTTYLGSKTYANIIYDEFIENKHIIRLPKKPKPTSYINVKQLKVEKLFTDTILIEGRAKIIGIANTVGPFSGLISIKVDNEINIKENMWDEWCYFTRKHIKISLDMENKAELTVLQDQFITVKNKYNVNFNKNKKNFILHSLYYTGEEVKILNISDGKYIFKTPLYIINIKARIIAVLHKYSQQYLGKK